MNKFEAFSYYLGEGMTKKVKDYIGINDIESRLKKVMRIAEMYFSKRIWKDKTLQLSIEKRVKMIWDDYMGIKPIDYKALDKIYKSKSEKKSITKKPKLTEEEKIKKTFPCQAKIRTYDPWTDTYTEGIIRDKSMAKIYEHVNKVNEFARNNSDRCSCPTIEIIG